MGDADPNNPPYLGASNPQPPARTGERVIPFGKYLLLDRIAIGGMAELYTAKSFGVEGFEKIIAIKRILPTMAEDEDFIQMFIDEAKIAGHLSHANIVPIYELGKIGESHYIAMEYVWGKDLLQIMNRFRRMRRHMPSVMAAWIASRMCEGLDFAHRKHDRHGRPMGIVHRDVSPQNVIVSYDGQVKLIDFGIAKAAARTTRTQAGVLKGKFGYMSPEQVKGASIDHRSDLFAVGTCMHEMLTGERLFVGESDFSTLEKVRNAEVAPPSARVPEVAPELEQIVLKALSQDPETRWQSAGEMNEALQAFIAKEKPPFGTNKLSAWMRTAFAAELAKEKARLDGFAKIGKPASVPPPPTRGYALDDPQALVAPPTRAFDPGLRREGNFEATATAYDDPVFAPTEVPEPPGFEEELAGEATIVGSSPFEEDELQAAPTQILFQNEAEHFGESPPATAPPSGVEVAPSVLVSSSVPVAGSQVYGMSVPAAPEVPGFGAGYAPPPGMAHPSQQHYAGFAGAGFAGGPPPSDAPAAGWSGPPPSEAARGETAAFRAPKRRSRVGLYVLGLLLLLLAGAGGAFAFVLYTNRAGGTIEVRSAPYAQVLLDGELSGTSPLRLEHVPPGDHTIELRAEGYRDSAQQVSVTGGAIALVQVSMAPGVGTPLGTASAPAATAADETSGSEAAGTAAGAGGESADESGAAEPTDETLVASAEGAEGQEAADPAAEPEPGSEAGDGEADSATDGSDSDAEGESDAEANAEGESEPAESDTDEPNAEESDAEEESARLAAGPRHPRRTRTRRSETTRRTESEAPRRETPTRRADTTVPRRVPHREQTSARRATPRARGFIAIRTLPWARVFVDGRDTGRNTPIRQLALSAGSHQIGLRTSDGRSVEISVEITAGETVQIVRQL